MKKIEELMNNKKSLMTLQGCLEEDINKAENELGVKFSEEYKEYLKTYGVV